MRDPEIANKTESGGEQPSRQAEGSRNSQATLNVLSGVLFLAVSFLLLFVFIPYGVDAPRKVKFAALHPAYYPQLVTYCLLIFGFLVLLGGMRQLFFSRQSLQANSVATSARSDDQSEKGERFFRLLPLALLFVVLFFALPYLGFPLSTAIALVLLMPLAGERRWHLILPIAVLLPLLLYLFFTQVANIPIPGGVLDPWLLKI